MLSHEPNSPPTCSYCSLSAYRGFQNNCSISLYKIDSYMCICRLFLYIMRSVHPYYVVDRKAEYFATPCVRISIPLRSYIKSDIPWEMERKTDR